MDSDIIIDTKFLLNNLKVHQILRKKNKKSITVGLFCFTSESNNLLLKSKIRPEEIKFNDFRVKCKYKKTWIGCKDDNKFVGKVFEIIKSTNFFRNWPKTGFVGPWLLTNMVLGGFFMLNRKDSLSVGGFDKSFKGYGFTETSLPTKLVAAFDHFVIPVTVGGCIHVGSKETEITKSKKDKIFKEKHKHYFDHYLSLTLKEAIKGGKI